MDATELKKAVKTLQQLNAEIDEVLNRTDEARRVDLVRLRRELAVQITRTSEAGNQLFSHAELSHLSGDFRQRLSAMRSALAIHQANWSAVRVDSNDIDYQRSVNIVRTTRKEFLDWVLTNMP